MASEVENKWRINREKNAAVRQLAEFAFADQQSKEVEIRFEEPCCIECYANGTLWVADEKVWDKPEKIWQIVYKLRDWLNKHHPQYLDKVDEWEAKDKEAARKARLAKIMGAIGNNLDDLPELKDEIVKLGRMIESGEEIQSYCRQFGG